MVIFTLIELILKEIINLKRNVMLQDTLRRYTSPVFTEYSIDTDISLVMATTTKPPSGPSESGQPGQDVNREDNFKTEFDE